jgi:hypothetical protein
MNIRSLHQLLSRIDEITVIGKYAEVDSVVCHVIGAVRYGMQMRLLVLQYDGAFQQRVEEAGGADLCDNLDMTESNRIALSGRGKMDFLNPFRAVRKVFIGEREFEVHSSQYQRLNIQDCECILLLSELLRHGWQPNGIDFQNIDMLFLVSLKLNGDYAAIPALGENPMLRFTMRPDSVSYLVEQPVTLTVVGKYQCKLRFQDAVTGEEHWAQINRVYLLDMWAEMAKTFTDSKLQKQMTPEQIAQAKSDFEERFLEICPKGMHFPIIEYECEEGISLNFYSKAYLDAVRVHSSRSSSMGFIVGLGQPTGILGLKLKAAIIQEPVPADTVSIEAELFQYTHTTTGGDIVLK